MNFIFRTVFLNDSKLKRMEKIICNDLKKIYFTNQVKFGYGSTPAYKARSVSTPNRSGSTKLL